MDIVRVTESVSPFSRNECYVVSPFLRKNKLNNFHEAYILNCSELLAGVLPYNNVKIFVTAKRIPRIPASNIARHFELIFFKIILKVINILK